MGKAIVSFDNITFQALPKLCTCEVNLNAPDPDDKRRVDVQGKTTIINRGEGPIEIAITDKRYVPKDWTLTWTQGVSGDLDGTQNFDLRSHDENLRTLSMNALYKHKKKERWKLLVKIQLKGVMGVIDPDIENQE
jgi:hypothetical protein